MVKLTPQYNTRVDINTLSLRDLSIWKGLGKALWKEQAFGLNTDGVSNTVIASRTRALGGSVVQVWVCRGIDMDMCCVWVCLYVVTYLCYGSYG